MSLQSAIEYKITKNDPLIYLY